jgi:hypothetical protein
VNYWNWDQPRADGKSIPRRKISHLLNVLPVASIAFLRFIGKVRTRRRLRLPEASALGHWGAGPQGSASKSRASVGITIQHV